MLRDLTSEQIADWRAFYRMEPWGWEVDTRRTGLIAWVVANFSERASRRIDMDDFLPASLRAPATLGQRLRAYFGAKGNS